MDVWMTISGHLHFTFSFPIFVTHPRSVVAGAAQTTEDDAVGVVPRLGETQQVDSTVATQLDDVVVLAQK